MWSIGRSSIAATSARRSERARGTVAPAAGVFPRRHRRGALEALVLAALACDGGAVLPQVRERGELEVAGGRLSYETSGRGSGAGSDVVVLLHDGLLPSVTWDAQVERWQDRFRLLRWDRRGYGASTTRTLDYADVDDLLALLDHLGIERAALVGCSSGGALALDFAVLHPTRVSALVLEGPIVSGLETTSHFVARGLGNTAPFLMRDDEKAALERWASDRYLTDEHGSEARALLRRQLDAFPDAALRRVPWSSRPEPDTLRRLGEIAVPTLLVVGESDIPEVHAQVGAIAAGIEDARRVVLPRAGHLAHLEHPDVFDEAVLPFLDPAGSAARALGAGGLGSPATPAARAAFDYDAASPIALEEHGRETRDGVLVRDISFASPLGGRVPAWLVEPAREGSFAGIVFLHHGQGNRSTFLDESVALAKRGAVSLSIDAPHLRPQADERPAGRPADAERDRREIQQTVTDLRRGFDVLLSLPNVDGDRLGYVGWSLGATMGARLAGVEPRAKALVLVAGFASLSMVEADQNRRNSAWLGALLDDAAMASYIAAIAELDGTHFLPGSAPLLLQFARHDEFILPIDAALFSAAARGRAEELWYEDRGHFELGDGPPMSDRDDWLAKHLGLASGR